MTVLNRNNRIEKYFIHPPVGEIQIAEKKSINSNLTRVTCDFTHVQMHRDEADECSNRIHNFVRTPAVVYPEMTEAARV